MAKYELWGRAGKGRRKRLAFGFLTETDARRWVKKLTAQGLTDIVVVQGAPRYGNVKGLLKKGRERES